MITREPNKDLNKIPVCKGTWEGGLICDNCIHLLDCINLQGAFIFNEIASTDLGVVMVDSIDFTAMEAHFGKLKVFYTENEIVDEELQEYVRTVTGCEIPSLISSYCELLKVKLKD